MKHSISPNLTLKLAAVSVALAIGCWSQTVLAQTTAEPAATDPSVPPVTPVVPPPNIIPGSPFAEVVRLTQAGVDEGIVTTYIENSTSTFNLDSGKIIYLSNLGVPKTIVTAMMQRDQQLQEQFAAAQQAQQNQPPPAAQTAPAPEVAPPNTPDNSPTTTPAPVTVNYFYNTLAPYGSWVEVGGYGRCWRPTVVVYDSSWQPYSDHGHWVYTDCGWYWASDYSWGATFHYGRWFRDASFGWCWYPDTVWGPSWVTWRYSNNYCGWAPLPPRTSFQAGVGIVYNGGGVSVGFNFGLGASAFVFVPSQHFCSPHPRNYRVAPAQVTQIYNNTTVINNYNANNRRIVNRGIAVENIAASTRTQIRPVPVHQVDTGFGHNNYKTTSRSRTDFSPNQPARTRDFGSPLRPTVSQAGSSTQLQRNNPTGVVPERNNPVVVIPKRSTPTANSSQRSPSPAVPGGAPSANRPQANPPASTPPAQQWGTPRSNANKNDRRSSGIDASPTQPQPNSSGSSRSSESWRSSRQSQSSQPPLPSTSPSRPQFSALSQPPVSSPVPQQSRSSQPSLSSKPPSRPQFSVPSQPSRSTQQVQSSQPPVSSPVPQQSRSSQPSLSSKPPSRPQFSPPSQPSSSSQQARSSQPSQSRQSDNYSGKDNLASR